MYPKSIPAGSPQDLEERKAAEVEDTTENDISDPEEEDDDLTDSQQTSKLSELYSTTVPSVDSAMDSWDGSGMDAVISSHGTTATTGTFVVLLIC